MMKERPILMTAESVKAILDGRKTLTRRLSKLGKYNREPDAWLATPSLNPSVWAFYKMAKVGVKDLTRIACPYGQVGDRLWVRERFFYGSGDYDNRTCFIRYAVDNVEIKYKIPDDFSWDKTCKWCYTKLDGSHPIRPSIFMPRWASRITLEITGVRVERLQDINTKTDELIAEGIPLICFRNNKTDWLSMAYHFSLLWDSLNLKRGYGWDKNPWVWVIKFDNIGVRVK